MCDLFVDFLRVADPDVNRLRNDHYTTGCVRHNRSDLVTPRHVKRKTICAYSERSNMTLQLAPIEHARRCLTLEERRLVTLGRAVRLANYKIHIAVSRAQPAHWHGVICVVAKSEFERHRFSEPKLSLGR